MVNAGAHRAVADGSCSECGAEYKQGEMIYGDRCAACRAASANSHEVDQELGNASVADLLSYHKKLLDSNRDKFQRTFGVPLHRFMHPLFGFDVIAFDDFLKTPDGQSTHDYLLEKFGQEADALIESLI